MSEALYLCVRDGQVVVLEIVRILIINKASLALLKKGLWSRCHQVTFPGQTGSTQAEMKANNQLKLTFNDLPDNRRFDLYIAEISTAGTLSQAKHISQVRFYIDSLRPPQGKGGFTNDEVGPS